MPRRAAPRPAPSPALVSSTAAAVLAVALATAAFGAMFLDHPGWAAPQVLIGFTGCPGLGTAVARARR